MHVLRPGAGRGQQAIDDGTDCLEVARASCSLQMPAAVRLSWGKSHSLPSPTTGPGPLGVSLLGRVDSLSIIGKW